MSKSLIIAEKPSVAADIARALGKFEKKDDFFENDQYVVSSAIGHLVELCLPGELDKKRGKWSFASLPIIPEAFELKPIEKTSARFNLLKRLLKRADITEVINACDAGREGELIFRYIIKLAGGKKPSSRLWLQSMTPDAIRTAFSRLRPESELVPLADAAICRSESDWLVGINATRAMTAFNSKTGGFQLTPVGRVQTPTLSILVEREEKIRAFKTRPYFELHADFAVEKGNYPGRWFDRAFKKAADEDGKPERIWDRSKAEAIRDHCVGKTGVVTEEKKPSSQIAPLLYDLTTLQREANTRFGFSARRTLQLAQQLYERHKVLTYPRTDSRYLPEDYLGTVKSTLGKFEDPSLAGYADKAVKNQWVKPSRRVFDGSKVSDHHAIIPTGLAPKNLDEAQEKIYRMVSQRLIAAFYPPAQFETTTRITVVENEAFKSEGKIIVQAGWMEVYGKEAVDPKEAPNVVPLTAGEKALAESIDLKEEVTRPPARYSEATLLSAMEGAGKTIEDEELRAAMSAKGLGTPATRAAIIEGLILDGYVVRQGRDLVASAKGISLITLLRGIGVQSLCSAELTGDWEHKLKQIEEKQFDRDSFMREIRSLTDDIVSKAKNFDSDTVDGNFVKLEAKCPKCGHDSFREDYRTYRCQSCDFIVWKTLAGRQFDAEEIRTLLDTGEVGPLEGFRSKIGRVFAAKVKLNAEGKVEFDFGSNGASGEKTVEELEKYPIVGPCTICGNGNVYELEGAYACQNTMKDPKTCTFRTGRTILQREIPREQIVKLLESGKTDLLTKFISKKNRPFSAHLKLDGGKVGFEFEKREKSEKPNLKVRKAVAKKVATAS